MHERHSHCTAKWLRASDASPRRTRRSIVRWWLVRAAERQRRGQGALELLDQALGGVEARAELADERVELADQALLVGELDVDVEPALVVGIGAIGHAR